MDAALASRLSTFSPEKRRLALHRLLRAGMAVAELPITAQPLRPAGECAAFDAQQRLLVLERLQRGTRYNRIDLALRLRGGRSRGAGRPHR